jgi:TatD DNase family protein
MGGEIGLDFFFVKDDSTYPRQRTVFQHFLAAAREQNKVVHWYSGPLDIFRELAALGVYFTMGIEPRYSAHVRAIAEAIPQDRLLSETDNPGAPKAYIGRPGTPLLIQEVVRGLAKVRGTTAEEIERTVEANLRRLVRDDPWLADVECRLTRLGN